MNHFEKLNLSATDIAVVTNTEGSTSLDTPSDVSTKDHLTDDMDEDAMEVDNDEMLQDQMDGKTSASE